MGEVHKARYTRLDRDVAIKILVEPDESAARERCGLAVEGLLQAAHENERARRPLGGIE